MKVENQWIGSEKCCGKYSDLYAKSYPNSIWVLQGWQQNPSDGLLAGLKKKIHLLLSSLEKIQLIGKRGKDMVEPVLSGLM